MIPTNPELRQFINQFFSDEELETLCFDYFPEASNDFGGGMSKNRKVIALVGYCERRDRLRDLHAAVARERASAWKQTFSAPLPETPRVETSRRDVSPMANERDPRQIFLSHATADAEFAHKLAADLRAEGWRVWIAPDSIRPGEKWVEAVDRGLETSGVFVVALTPDAVASRWVNTETDAAVEMQHEEMITLIPLDVIACQPKRLWRQYQYVPFRGSYEVGLDALLTRLDAQSTGPSRPLSGTPRIEVREQALEPPKPATDPNRRIHEKTGIELIRIPAGPFLYDYDDSDDGDDIADDDKPSQRTVELPEYWIGRYPVTNAQYKRFIDARPGYRVPSVLLIGRAGNWDKKRRTFPDGKADHPVVNVRWDDIKAFCDWAGLTLPTEDQWLKAARGTDGRVWPWGNEEPTTEHCNFNENIGDTTPVGKYSPKGDSPYGCADMAGNVWELTGSWYTEGKSWVRRGGAWYSNNYMLNVQLEDPSPGISGWNNDCGFRVLELLSDPES